MVCSLSFAGHYSILFNEIQTNLKIKFKFTESGQQHTSDIKIKLRSPNNSEHIYEKAVGPYRGFDYLRLISDPLVLAT